MAGTAGTGCVETCSISLDLGSPVHHCSSTSRFWISQIYIHDSFARRVAVGKSWFISFTHEKKMKEDGSKKPITVSSLIFYFFGSYGWSVFIAVLEQIGILCQIWCQYVYQFYEVLVLDRKRILPHHFSEGDRRPRMSWRVRHGSSILYSKLRKSSGCTMPHTMIFTFFLQIAPGTWEVEQDLFLSPSPSPLACSILFQYSDMSRAHALAFGPCTSQALPNVSSLHWGAAHCLQESCVQCVTQKQYMSSFAWQCSYSVLSEGRIIANSPPKSFRGVIGNSNFDYSRLRRTHRNMYHHTRMVWLGCSHCLILFLFTSWLPFYDSTPCCFLCSFRSFCAIWSSHSPKPCRNRFGQGQKLLFLLQPR